MRLTSFRRKAGSHDHRSNQEQGGRNLAEDVGRRYHLVAGETDSYIDLLFYSLKLRRYIAVELKNEEFKPEYAGKLGFCIAAVDDELRGPDKLLLRQGLRRARARRGHRCELLVRKLVKLDHDAAMEAFAGFINSQSLTERQISFVRIFNTQQQLGLVAVINRIKENAERPAA